MGNDRILDNLSEEYNRRFSGKKKERIRVWEVLVDKYFQPLIGQDKSILDLGCGYGEFINQISATKKYGMDLNPDSESLLNHDVDFLRQDCSKHWNLPDNSLDVVFTSNFFEHLPDKKALSDTIDQACRCLKPSGRLICMGPNIKYLPGKYWDFWDHFVPLTELSLEEGLELHGFRVIYKRNRFLPYTMSNRKPAPSFMIALYLSMPFVWRLMGHQFIIVAEKK